MTKTLHRLDDAGPLIKAREDFTSRTRETPYGTFTSMSGYGVATAGHFRFVDKGYLPQEYHESFEHATYATYSYDTPMAWWLERPPPGAPNEQVEAWLDGGQVGFWVMPSVSYSSTTNQHQSIIAEAIDPFYERDEDGNVRSDGTTYGYVKRQWTTEFRQLGWNYKHKYKNRGENADGPSVERHGY